MALRIAKHLLAAGKQLDLLVVEVAAILHDVLDKKYVQSKLSGNPFAFFLPFFESFSSSELDILADGRAQLVVRIVDNISWSTEQKLRESGHWSNWHDSCLELHCVQDADRLDAIGAIGMCGSEYDS
jgi:uncharacterized protein